jgi:hypothetical protein
VKYTIDPETDIALLTARFEMNVACALIECVLKQPVYDAHHVLVIRIQFA